MKLKTKPTKSIPPPSPQQERHFPIPQVSKRLKGQFLLDINNISFTIGSTSPPPPISKNPKCCENKKCLQCYGGVFKKASPKELSSRDLFVQPKSLEKDTDTTCSICLTSFSKNKFVWKLSCNHYFHYNCIEKWSDLENYTCPMCRKYYNHP